MYRTLIIFIFAMGVRSSPTPSFVTPYARPARNLRQQYGNRRVITPQIYEMNILSTVSNRYATTIVTSKVRNRDQYAQEATFSVILPEAAFITCFIMDIGGKNYTAFIKDMKEAKKIYDTAVSQGEGAALVAVSARDSNSITVSVNVEPQTNAVFYLYYEELLKRRKYYDLVINIYPNQYVPNLNVQVLIKETIPLSTIRTPALRSGRDIRKNKGDLDPRATIVKLDSKSAIVEFSPTQDKQKQYAQLLGSADEQGFSTQFVVQYDVERDASGGEILVKDGYFVHFFAPDIKPLPKHIIFVLDTSASMRRNRLKQLKEAMNNIFDDLNDGDLFHLVEFGSNIRVRNINQPGKTIILYRQTGNREINLNYVTFPDAYPVNEDNIRKAHAAVNAFSAAGLTNIYEALRVAIRLAKNQRIKSNNNKMQPLIMFLTDGDPTAGITNRDHIISKLSRMNERIPIFSLSFGNGADRKFLQRLSLQNYGFARHIYESADSALQLEGFYEEISSPILANVNFKYADDARKLTRTSFPTYFGGSEVIVSGTIGNNFEKDRLSEVFGLGVTGNVQLKPKVHTPIGDMERLWAYLTVQQLLEDREIANNKTEIEKKALDIALKYSFVTALTSLVVVKPNETPKPVSPRAAYKEHVLFTTRFGDTDYDYDDETNAPPEIEDIVDPELKKLMATLPWLSSIYNSKNESLTLPKGSYKLGLGKQVEEIKLCGNGPNGSIGQCTLLHNCAQFHGEIPTLNSYVSRFCAIESYAGICCATDQFVIM